MKHPLNTAKDLDQFFPPAHCVLDQDIPPTLIYSGTQNGTGETLCQLNVARGRSNDSANGMSSFTRRYHAGTGTGDKADRAEDFVASRYPVVCCTMALGLGQNWKLVRRVIVMGRMDPATVVQMFGRCGRDGRPGVGILFVEEKRGGAGSKNDPKEFGDPTNMTDDKRMDALAVTPVCLRVALAVDNYVGYIPVSFDDVEYIKEKQRQMALGFAPCLCSNCEPDLAEQFLQAQHQATKDNMSDLITNLDSLVFNHDTCCPPIEARPNLKIIMTCPTKDPIRDMHIMKDLVSCLVEAFEVLYQQANTDGEFEIPPEMVFNIEDHAWPIAKNADIISQGVSLRGILGSQSIKVMFDCLLECIKDWEQSDLYALHQSEIIEASRLRLAFATKKLEPPKPKPPPKPKRTAKAAELEGDIVVDQSGPSAPKKSKAVRASRTKRTVQISKRSKHNLKLRRLQQSNRTPVNQSNETFATPQIVFSKTAGVQSLLTHDTRPHSASRTPLVPKIMNDNQNNIRYTNMTPAQPDSFTSHNLQNTNLLFTTPHMSSDARLQRYDQNHNPPPTNVNQKNTNFLFTTPHMPSDANLQRFDQNHNPPPTNVNHKNTKFLFTTPRASSDAHLEQFERNYNPPPTNVTQNNIRHSIFTLNNPPNAMFEHHHSNYIPPHINLSQTNSTQNTLRIPEFTSNRPPVAYSKAPPEQFLPVPTQEKVRYTEFTPTRPKISSSGAQVERSYQNRFTSLETNQNQIPLPIFKQNHLRSTHKQLTPPIFNQVHLPSNQSQSTPHIISQDHLQTNQSTPSSFNQNHLASTTQLSQNNSRYLDNPPTRPMLYSSRAQVDLSGHKPISNINLNEYQNQPPVINTNKITTPASTFQNHMTYQDYQHLVENANNSNGSELNYTRYTSTNQ